MIFFNLLPSVIAALICNVNFLGCYVIVKTRNEIEEKIAGCITNSMPLMVKAHGFILKREKKTSGSPSQKIKLFFL